MVIEVEDNRSAMKMRGRAVCTGYFIFYRKGSWLLLFCFLTKSQFVCLPFGAAPVLEAVRKLVPVLLPSLFSSLHFKADQILMHSLQEYRGERRVRASLTLCNLCPTS